MSLFYTLGNAKDKKGLSCIWGIHYRQNKGYFENAMEILVFQILLFWKWLGTNQEYCNLMQLSGIVIQMKMQLAMSEIKDPQGNLDECLILVEIVRRKFPTTSNLFIITLWIYKKFGCIQ